LSAPPGNLDRCPKCGRSTQLWLTYECRRCGAFHVALYRAEHVDPARAVALSLEEMRAEYRRAEQTPPRGLTRAAVRRAAIAGVGS